MPNKKTAISIEQPLFEEVEALAKELDVSRSFLFTLAARNFVQDYKNKKLLDAINSAHKKSPDLSEKILMTRMKSKHRRLVKERW
jgi:metal-responsive CopG/Arc/MetJ family transcriptional regulator